MYRQKSSPFGHPQIRVNSVPENYSGNAFLKQTEEKAESEYEAEEVIAEDIIPQPTSVIKTDNKSRILPAKINIPEDNAILFLTLLILAANEEKDDGALLTVLMLLLIN